MLHPTSFPGRFGMGDLGLEALQFIDFLAATKQQFWQVLPLGPTAFGNSPYMCYSALAGNPFLISLELLRDEGLLSDEDLANFPEFSQDQVDFDRVTAAKIPLLQKAYAAFNTNASATLQEKFAGFCQSKAYWLEDFSLFMALKQEHEGGSWHTWKPGLAKRDKSALEQARDRLSHEISYFKFLQFMFFQQWSALRQYANLRGIQIIGDIPIYVAHDSADVWANPQNFRLDPETSEAALMAGVPPDYFSETGQLWGNPVYDWEHLRETNFRWWIQRFEAMLDYVDLIRIDHFRGFEAFWAVDRGEETATNGRWIEAPGTEFFEMLQTKLGNLPILAEDLGVITPEVEALRDRFEFPGMKILQFAFGSDPGNGYLPCNYPRRCLVYTGTHDNDTTIGWFNTLSDYEQNNLLHYIGCISAEGVHWDLIRLAMGSVSDLAIIPLQDLMGLGTEARMNTPGTAEGNWGWRYRSEMLTDEMRDRFNTLTQIFNRAPVPKQC